jgi:lipoate-protein ligase B
MSGVADAPHLRVIDLGRLSYAAAYDVQVREHARVMAAREHREQDGVAATLEDGSPGTILLVEHVPPVITVSRRAGAGTHLVATPERLAAEGVEVVETDRGGDITYHGPGQLVVYPVIDLNFFRLNLHAYMRVLEQSVIDAMAAWGVTGTRDPAATGVWVDGAKVCAMGVRVRHWVTMHGLALNVTTNLRHFDLIVPCGLVGRSVTSLEALLAQACPSMDSVKRGLVGALVANLSASQ